MSMLVAAMAPEDREPAEYRESRLSLRLHRDDKGAHGECFLWTDPDKTEL